MDLLQSSSPHQSLLNLTDEEDEEIPNWLYDDDDPRSYFMPVNQLKYTDPVTVRRVYSLARRLHSVLSKIELVYWTSGGTTLGIVRHGGLIPWDDDVDICILIEDVPKLLKSVSEFEDCGLTLQEAQTYSFKIFDPRDSDAVQNSHYTHRYPFCDVFVMQKVKDEYTLCDKIGRNTWPNEKYLQHQIDHIEPRKFGNFYLQCPGDPQLYLSNTYGDNWDRKGATHFFNHANAGYFRSEYFDMDQDMFMPAVPFD